MTGHGRYRHLGRTLDDAAGEAFDKGARLLGLGYPGGPAIERAAAAGDPARFELPRAWLGGSHDFSFSGLKTALLRLIEPYRRLEPATDRRAPPSSPSGPFPEHRPVVLLPSAPVADFAAAFQEAVVEVLAVKTARGGTPVRGAHGTAGRRRRGEHAPAAAAAARGRCPRWRGDRRPLPAARRTAPTTPRWSPAPAILRSAAAPRSAGRPTSNRGWP